MTGSTRKRTKLWLVSAACLTILISSCAFEEHSESDETFPLTSGRPVERELRFGVVHTYEVLLNEGEHLHAVVAQRGANVVVKVLGPNQRQLVMVDRPGDFSSEESVWFTAPVSGTYRLRIGLADGVLSNGLYRIEADRPRLPTGEDAKKLAAFRTLMEGQALQRRGSADDLRQAVDKYSKARRLWEVAGERLQQVLAWRAIAETEAGLADLNSELRAYEQALQIAVELRNREQEIEILNEIGRLHRLLGRSDIALRKYQEALTLANKSGYTHGKASSLNNIAVLHYIAGRLETALELFLQVVTIRRQGTRPTLLATALENLGNVYSNLGWMDHSLENLYEALELRRRSGDIRGEANALTSLGWAHNLKGEPETSIRLYEDALRLQERKTDLLGRIGTLDRLATTRRKLRQFEKAEIEYGEALDIAKQGGYRKSQAHTLNNLCRLYIDWERFGQAFDSCQKSQAIFKEEKDPNAEAYSHYLVALAKTRIGNRREALESIRTALQIIDSQRFHAKSPLVRRSYSATRHDYSEFLVDLLMQLDEVSDDAGFDVTAFEAAQDSQARGLLEILLEGQAGSRRSDAELLKEEELLQERINLLAGRQQSEVSGSENDLVPLLVQLGKIRRTRTGSWEQRLGTAVELSEIQAMLDAETLMLAYFSCLDRTFLWLVGHDLFESHILPGRPEIESKVRNFYDLFRQTRLGIAQAQAELVAESLSQVLLGPAAKHLGNKRLVVVSEGFLQYLPFAALPAPLGPNSSRAGRYMIVDHEIVVLPSASILPMLRQDASTRTPAPKSMTIFADPVFDESDDRARNTTDPATPHARSSDPSSNPSSDPTWRTDLKRAADDVGLPRFNRLPYSLMEAEAILEMLPEGDALVATGFAASKATALAAGLRDYRILHFATHSVLHPRYPELSGLVLSTVDEQGRSQDGFLRAHEISNLDLCADLVVLSACRTALGTHFSGEGLVGLTQGFMYAGAARIVVSLWDIGDRPTAHLMRHFYKALLTEKLRPAAALRKAQMAMLEGDWQAPYYWAGFVFQGEWN